MYLRVCKLGFKLINKGGGLGGHNAYPRSRMTTPILTCNAIGYRLNMVLSVCILHVECSLSLNRVGCKWFHWMLS